MPELRVLGPGDEVDLDTFLARHADTSMFLRANARAAGLLDHGEPMQATYVAAMAAGRITGVAAHCWNGMVLVQAPEHVAAVTREAVRRSGRAVTGFSGPWEQVVAARRALDLDAAPATKDSRDELHVLDLAQLILPPGLATGELRCRHPEEGELARLMQWRAQFSVEALGATDGAELRRSSRADVLLHHQRGSDWVLLVGPNLVSYAVFNAMLPEIVQVGGVWTPPELRGRGYARSVVAGSLLSARKQSVRRAVLFADPSNAAARAAYLALGFRIVGDYGLVLLKPPPTG
ncbi:MAG TPA: GNAT family N-acetyltransferase [Gemmatimonadales bacterium]|nr:GNAT family N-acetyltransferase [Gemmatimonadales bacterium]